MNRSTLFGALLGILSMSAAADSENREPFLEQGGWPATRHQAAVARDAPLEVTQDLATPRGQVAAEAPERRVTPELFGDFPATIHQASLGLAR
jgi:hypothetical protein